MRLRYWHRRRRNWGRVREPVYRTESPRHFPLCGRSLCPCLRLSVLLDRKCTRLNSSHSQNSYPGFCLKKKRVERNQQGGLLCVAPIVCVLQPRHINLSGVCGIHSVNDLSDYASVLVPWCIEILILV